MNNPSYTDIDSDGVMNVLDKDSDNDGIPDAVEGSEDTDGDGSPNYMDEDSDDDGIGDADESGLIGARDDNGRFIDTDGDGVPDVIDTAPFDVSNSTIKFTLKDTDGDTIPDYLDLDSDDDGITDEQETGAIGIRPKEHEGANIRILRDTDGDGVTDYLDLDSDNDCISDIEEAGNGKQNTNNTGMAGGADADKDGIRDSVDGLTQRGTTRQQLPDKDKDGVPDYLDTDSDGSGIGDIGQCRAGLDKDDDGRIDNAIDADRDGIADVIDMMPTAYGGITNVHSHAKYRIFIALQFNMK